MFTSNVDGQFQMAGFSTDHILECHGSIHHWQCSECSVSGIWSAPDIDLDIDEQSLKAAQPLPICSECDSVARPNILMFGDWGWNEQRTQAQQQRYHQFLNRAGKGKLVCIELGAGCDIPTVRYQCESSGGILIRINPRNSYASGDAVSIPMGALDALQKLDELM